MSRHGQCPCACAHTRAHINIRHSTDRSDTRRTETSCVLKHGCMHACARLLGRGQGALQPRVMFAWPSGLEMRGLSPTGASQTFVCMLHDPWRFATTRRRSHPRLAGRINIGYAHPRAMPSSHLRQLTESEWHLRQTRSFGENSPPDDTAACCGQRHVRSMLQGMRIVMAIGRCRAHDSVVACHQNSQRAFVFISPTAEAETLSHVNANLKPERVKKKRRTCSLHMHHEHQPIMRSSMHHEHLPAHALDSIGAREKK